MIKFLYRHKKDYSRIHIIKHLTEDLNLVNDVFILLPFSKNQFFKFFFKRNKIINDFFISNYDTYVYDRKKITNKNPRAWWKYFQDWFNFKFSKFLLSDTQSHFEYWEELFGKFEGEHMVLPVLADKTLYYPMQDARSNDKIRILFYGSFIPLHGIDIILNAFKIMEDKNVDFEANIIGNGQMYPKMKELFDKLDLKNVTMNGEIIEEIILAQKIREHDIILGIFGNSKKAKSVVPNKVYQALASKKTIVTMESKTIEEFFDNNDLVMCNNTEMDLAETLINLLKTPNLLDIISSKGYNKFLNLYTKTQLNFINFIQKIDNEIG